MLQLPLERFIYLTWQWMRWQNRGHAGVIGTWDKNKMCILLKSNQEHMRDRFLVCRPIDTMLSQQKFEFLMLLVSLELIVV